MRTVIFNGLTSVIKKKESSLGVTADEVHLQLPVVDDNLNSDSPVSQHCPHAPHSLPHHWMV